jgi:hypothetical protein
MIHRLVGILMTKANFNKEKNIIKYSAIKNGYRPTLIENMLKEKLKKQKEQKSKEYRKKKYLCLPYNTKINKAIRKTFQKSDFTIAYHFKYLK